MLNLTSMITLDGIYIPEVTWSIMCIAGTGGIGSGRPGPPGPVGPPGPPGPNGFGGETLRGHGPKWLPSHDDVMI